MNTKDTINSQYSYEDILNNFWDLADESVKRFANKEYIVTNKGRLTYSQVNQYANVIYAAITNQYSLNRVGIGLFLKDALKIIPAMIGSLKAKHYFIPLDVTSPKTTLDSILNSAEIKIILTDNENLLQAKELPGFGNSIINIDDLDFTNPPPNPIIKHTPDDWVQILFTSGSTGLSKGAIENYRYLAYAAHQKRVSHLYNFSDRLLQLPNFTFSGPHTIVFGALFIGTTICFYNVKENGLNGLGDWIRQEKITSYNSTATIFRSWANTLNSEERFPLIQFARTGAEKIGHRDIESLKKIFPNVKYIRLGFASTETQAIASKMFPVDYDFGETDLPCGTPHDKLKVMIWDENGNDLPVEKAGEIVVYSDTLVRGYINNPALTKEKFIPDLNNPIFQYYKTGDLGKIREDGMLVHLGRIDDMIKIKGVRIELNSIEKHMLDYPGILQVTFKIFDDKKGNKKITAYLIPEIGLQIPISDLRNFLTERLPSHQIPHFFIQLDNFPLTRTGKLDKNQLPPPAMTRPHLSNLYAAPTTDLESTLVRIWEEEVGIEGIGVTDDFFEIGGDSLIGVVLFIRIEQELKRNLPVSTLLSASTIRSQIEIITNQTSGDNFSPLITINSQGENTPLFFIPGKGGYPTRIRHLAKLLDLETPIYALQDLMERQGHTTLRRVESIATFYINEIRKVTPHGPYLLVGESMGGKIAMEMAQQMKNLGEDVPLLVLLDTYNFDDSLLGKNRVQYYWMLIRKHSMIIFGADWHGKMDYLKFYRETLIDKITKWIKRRLDRSKRRLTTTHNIIRETERKNFRAANRYYPRPYPGKVLLLKALRGPNAGEPANGWDKVKLGELVIHPLDCYHGSILFEPAVNELAKTLNDYIAKENNQTNHP